MTPEEENELHTIITTFGTVGLGEGDMIAGVSVLTAMAHTLPNISPPGCGIQSPGLGRMRAGGSLLVSGPLSSSLVTDDIVTEVALGQNHLIANLRRLLGDKIADARKKGLKTVEFPSGPKANAAENAIFQLEHKEPPLFGSVEGMWAEIMAAPPNPRIEDLVARPKVVVTVGKAADLDKQLCGLHGGRPLVLLGLNRAADVSALGETCSSILNGLFATGLDGETAAGHLLITDPTGVLDEVARNANDKTKWLGRMLHLVEGDAGPEVPGKPNGNGTVRLSDMTGRFATALLKAFGSRLNNHEAGTVLHKVDLDAAQLRWVKFLQGMENHLPGISGTAHGLLATLSFGLIELAHAEGFKRLRVKVAGIEALGRFLVRRMANARTSMLWSAEQAWRMQIARRIFLRLADGRMTNRDIYRNLGIPAALCEELLWEMEASGTLHRVRRKWERVEGGTFPDPHGKHLPLDV
jgi:hypothetical protein